MQYIPPVFVPKTRPSRSCITYSVGRPFPFKWFTPVAIIGGIVLTVLLSLLNYALNGFELVPYSFEQPPMLQKGWYSKVSALQTNALEANCTPVNIPVNSQFFTNQSGLTYTLSAVWHMADDIDEIGQTLYAPSLSYYNQPFENCSVYLLQVEMEELDRTADQINTAAWGQVVRAFVGCSVRLLGGNIVHVSLTTTYETIPEAYSLLLLPQGLITTDQYHRASLWWGESHLSALWANISASLIDATHRHGRPPFRKGLIEWVPNDGITDIMDPSFFKMTYSLVVDIMNPYYTGNFINVYPAGTNISHPGQVSELIANASGGGDGSFNNGTVILFAADKLVRCMHPTININLGQTAQPISLNVLLQETALQSYSSSVAFSPFPWVIFLPGPARGDYNSLKDTTGKLQVMPSVISTRYTCQIPTRKAAGPLILSVLIADLVLLQLAWKLYVFITGLLLQERDRPNYCEGCLKYVVLSEGTPMDTMETSLQSDERPATRHYDPLEMKDDSWHAYSAGFS